ncbi:MAG: glutaredoxin 3 [Gammaproteobacteria bacterium]|nr:glutaredoxin 3 [Gammaproteobacteria bacterium]
MPKVVMYTTTLCPYCVRAKALLHKKDVKIEERHIEKNRAFMREMLQRSKQRTVPQIFIDDYHVGGYDKLAELNAFGKLDQLLDLKPDNAPEVTQGEPDPT